MPGGPKGERRPLGNAVHVMWLATREISRPPKSEGQEPCRRGSGPEVWGGAAKRREIAPKAASSMGFFSVSQ